MKSLLARFQKKWGPLPIWAWTGIASAAGWYFLKIRSGATATASQTAVDPAFVSAGDVGDLSPNGSGTSGDTTPVTTPGEAFPDAGIKSDIQDFLNQAFDQALAERAGADGTGLSVVDPNATGDRTPADWPAPASGGAPRKAFPFLASPKARPKKKKAAKPKPKRKALPRLGGRRSSAPASHGSGGAGARKRVVKHPVKKRPPRRRAPVRPDNRGGPRTTAKRPRRPKPKRPPYRGRH